MTRTPRGKRTAPLIYPVGTAIIGILMVTSIGVRLTEGDDHVPSLPRQLRISETKLSGFPVEVSALRGCTCLSGPRGQAQKKYKFRIVNRTDDELNIGGGLESSIRLLVAYREPPRPTITMPDENHITTETRYVQAPSRRPLRETDSTLEVVPVEVVDGHVDATDLFGVPEDYRVWALPPNPNKLVEELAEGNSTYPTYIEKTELLPNEEYSDSETGVGVWTFYAPLPEELAQPPGIPFEFALPRSEVERYLIVIGVAVMVPSSTQEGWEWLGFAPSPSDDNLIDPVDL